MVHLKSTHMDKEWKAALSSVKLIWRINLKAVLKTLSEVTNNIHSPSYTLSSPSSQRFMWKTNPQWKHRSICTSVPPGKAQLKPLNYKTHSASHGQGIIKIHYFLHSELQSLQNQCQRDVTRNIGVCPLSLDFFPNLSFSDSQFGPWSLPFLCAVVLQKKRPLKC